VTKEVKLCVLDSPKYKLLLGLDVLTPLHALFDVGRRRLYLTFSGD
jgi:hypothetical protein